jgi:poly-gamma-glutamate system protein
MKTIYWQAHNLPRLILLGFCLFILAGLVLVEQIKEIKPQAYYQEKLAATVLTQKSFAAIKKIRTANGFPITKSLDPQGFGLIGKQFSSITSDASQLENKVSTINPNISAVFVHWLKELDLRPGDIVAVNMTGSFPALDIAMLSAITILELKPLLVFSAASSQFGANIPYFSWTDMYYALSKQKIFTYPVLGISIGGKHDRGYGMPDNGVAVLKKTIAQYNYPLIDSVDTIDAVNKRMDIYHQYSEGQLIAAFINVGGNMASIGLKQINKNDPVPRTGKIHSIDTGVVDKLPINLVNTDSVAVRFLKEGIPVINVHNISKHLIAQYHFPKNPQAPIEMGTGEVFYNLEYMTWLAILVLLVDIAAFIIITIYSKKYVIRYKQ